MAVLSNVRAAGLHVLHLVAVAGAAAVGLAGCSASPQGESVKSTTEAFHEVTCPNTPDATYLGRISAPDNGTIKFANVLQAAQNSFKFFSNVGYISPETYSNPNCGYGTVVQVTGWLEGDSDLVIAAHDNPVPPGANISQADCEGLFLAATVYAQPNGWIGQNGAIVSSLTREAGGVFFSGTNGLGIPVTGCTPPEIFFGGRTSRDGDVDGFDPGQTYTFAATYRTSVGRHITTHAVSMYNRPGKCGDAGKACCTVNESTTSTALPWCWGQNVCLGGSSGIQTGLIPTGTCAPCGTPGQHWCGFAGQPQCYGAFTEPSGDSCISCGANGATCCNAPTRLDPNSPLCVPGLVCNGGTCGGAAVPPPERRPPPAMPGAPTRCNGSAGTAKTMQHLVDVENSASCGNAITFWADSDAEAQKCAEAQGYTVLTGQQAKNDYPFCVCSFGGTSVTSYPAYSQNSANRCVANDMVNAFQFWPLPIGATDCTASQVADCEALMQ